MKRKTIYWILAVVAVLALGFLMLRASVNRGLGKRVAAVRESVRNGVLQADGSTAPSVYEAMQARLDGADSLLTLAAKYDGIYSDYTALRSAFNILQTALKEQSAFAVIREADAALALQVDVCAAALEPLAEGKAAEQLKASLEAFHTAADTVEAAVSAYNNGVLVFRAGTLNKLPNSLVKGLVSGGLPELWPTT